MSEEQTAMPWAPLRVPFHEKLPHHHTARAAMQKRALEHGHHPLQGDEIPKKPGDVAPIGTCGECVHLVRRGGGGAYGKGFAKCELHEDSSVRTDVTLRWPACRLFERKEEP